MLPWRYPDKPIEATPSFVAGLKEDEWLVNGKYDGWRMPIFTDENSNPHFFSRSGRPMGSATKFPLYIQKVVEEFTKVLPPLSVLDSEFIGPRGGHKHRIFLFDILAWNGTWQVRVPYEQRWNLLVKTYNSICLIPEHWQGLQLAETVTMDFLGYFNKLKQMWYDGGCSSLDLHEGIVVKRKSGLLTLKLTASSKSQHQFKIKYRDVREKRW